MLECVQGGRGCCGRSSVHMTVGLVMSETLFRHQLHLFVDMDSKRLLLDNTALTVNDSKQKRSDQINLIARPRKISGLAVDRMKAVGKWGIKLSLSLSHLALKAG